MSKPPKSIDPIGAAFAAGLAAGKGFCREIGERFGTIVNRPKNPYEKNTGCSVYWNDGFDWAICEWFLN